MPPFNPQLHHRRSIRLKGYDYSQAGAYFVTLVTQGRVCLFGDVINGKMKLNGFGNVIAESWQWLEGQYAFVELGAWVVMPNHLHGIIIINDERTGDSVRRGDSRIAPTNNTQKIKPLGRLIGAFKTVSTKRINLINDTAGQPLWQRNYYEHIIRNEAEISRIWAYIEPNPIRWEEDGEKPSAGGRFN